MVRPDPSISRDRAERARFWTVFGRIAVYAGLLTFCLLGWAAIIAGCERVAHCSPLACEGISNADARHYCRAISKPDKLECELIKDRDLRFECRARAGDHP